MDMANQAVSGNYGSVNIYNMQSYKKYCERLQNEVSTPISFELRGGAKGMLSRIHAHMAKRKAIRAEYLQAARLELQAELEKQGVAFDGQNIIFKKSDAANGDTTVTTVTTETQKNLYTPNHTQKEVAAIEIERAKLDKELQELEKVDVSAMNDDQLLDHKVKLSVYHNAQKAFDVLQKSYAADDKGLETLNNKLNEAKKAIKEYYTLKYGDAIKNDDNKIARIALGALLKSHKKPQTTTVVAFGGLTTAGRKTEPAPTVTTTTTTTTVTTQEGEKPKDTTPPKAEGEKTPVAEGEKAEDKTPPAPPAAEGEKTPVAEGEQKEGAPVAPAGEEKVVPEGEKAEDKTPPAPPAAEAETVTTTTTVTTTEVVEPKTQEQKVVVVEVEQTEEPEEGTIEYTLKQQKTKEDKEKKELQEEADKIALAIKIGANGLITTTDKKVIQDALALLQKGATITVNKTTINQDDLLLALNNIVEAELESIAREAIDALTSKGDSDQNKLIATWFENDNKILKAVMVKGDFFKLVDDKHLSDWIDNDDAYTNIIQGMKSVIAQAAGNPNMFANEPTKYKLSCDDAKDVIILQRLRNIYMSVLEQK